MLSSKERLNWNVYEYNVLCKQIMRTLKLRWQNKKSEFFISLVMRYLTFKFRWNTDKPNLSMILKIKIRKIKFKKAQFVSTAVSITTKCKHIKTMLLFWSIVIWKSYPTFQLVYVHKIPHYMTQRRLYYFVRTIFCGGSA